MFVIINKYIKVYIIITQKSIVNLCDIYEKNKKKIIEPKNLQKVFKYCNISLNNDEYLALLIYRYNQNWHNYIFNKKYIKFQSSYYYCNDRNMIISGHEITKVFVDCINTYDLLKWLIINHIHIGPMTWFIFIEIIPKETLYILNTKYNKLTIYYFDDLPTYCINNLDYKYSFLQYITDKPFIHKGLMLRNSEGICENLTDIYY